MKSFLYFFLLIFLSVKSVFSLENNFQQTNNDLIYEPVQEVFGITLGAALKSDYNKDIIIIKIDKKCQNKIVNIWNATCPIEILPPTKI